MGRKLPHAALLRCVSRLRPGVCLNVNPDWNLLPLPDKERAMENIST
ncbi:MAG TPA: hypothetical protein VLW51_08355 [Solirubrobacteraceae bacterium]|nr:hypothetical protein [Solirubrobacteraceae bacterium]